LAATLAGAVAVTLAAAPALGQGVRTPAVEKVSTRAIRGSVSGTVTDDHGGPLAGAMVSAIGATMAMTVTDDFGRFALDVPPGEYVFRAHMNGFAASRRELVRIGASSETLRFNLRRIDSAAPTTGEAPVKTRPIVQAGISLPPGEKADADDDHPHGETAWRLRRIKRSILKETSPGVIVAADPEEIPLEGSSTFGRAFGSAAQLATSWFLDAPLSGEVNFLTTSALGPDFMFSGDSLPRGVAYFSLGAPTGAGDWKFRAAMSQGDLSSWIVAGAFVSKPSTTAAHSYDFGLSYSKQEYFGGNRAALAAVRDGSRNVGEMYGFDRWRVTPYLSMEYGARYAHYDYLQDRGLISPRVAFTVVPFSDTRVKTTVGQRMVAPGAEEFLSPNAPGPWLPPERTFAPLASSGLEAEHLRVERARFLEVEIEHEFEDAYIIGVRRFVQTVDDQLVTLFGLDISDAPRSVGHYFVASAGGVDASGWGVRMSTSSAKAIRASVDYSLTRTRWTSRGDSDTIAAFAPAAVRPEFEDLHDVTTSIETRIEETATRVFVLYKINTGFTRENSLITRPSLDGRFDVQVNQALPLHIAGTRWEVLVGLRNLFRDPDDRASVYDELLVVKPPKRVVGGVLVRF
jgi:hypothetical protein